MADGGRGYVGGAVFRCYCHDGSFFFSRADATSRRGLSSQAQHVFLELRVCVPELGAGYVYFLRLGKVFFEVQVLREREGLPFPSCVVRLV